MINREELFKKWCKKLTQTTVELEKEYKERFDKDKSEHPDLTDEERDKYILGVMQGFYKRQFMSPAKVFEGTVIGIMRKFDTVVNTRKTAIDLYVQDPERAIRDGYTDNEGNPIFLTPEWRKGKAVPEHSWNRNLIVIAFQPEGKDTTPKPYIMSMRDEQAELLPQLFRKCTFRATLSKDETTLRSSRVTEFKDLGEDMNFKDLVKFLDDNFIPAKDLSDWYTKNKDEKDRIGFKKFIVTKGIVSNLNLKGTDYGKAIITITDLGMGFIADDNEIVNDITCWISFDMPDIKFGVGSEIYIVGRPKSTKEGEIQINVCGIWPDPKFIKAPPEESQELNEQTIQPTESKPLVPETAEKNSTGTGEGW